LLPSVAKAEVHLGKWTTDLLRLQGIPVWIYGKHNLVVLSVKRLHRRKEVIVQLRSVVWLEGGLPIRALGRNN